MPGREPWASANTFQVGIAKSLGGQGRGLEPEQKEAGTAGTRTPAQEHGRATTSAFCFFLLTFSQRKVKSKT